MKLTFDSNVFQFEKRFKKKLKEKGDKKTQEFIVHLAFLFLQLVIPRTPVDTGRARAGWYPASQALGLGTGTGKGEGKIEKKLKGKKKHIDIYNRVHYIVYLEYGHSGQAPSGFARISLAEIKRLIKQKKV